MGIPSSERWSCRPTPESIRMCGAPPAPAPSATGEAVAALMGLGVTEPQARRVVEAAAARLDEDVEPAALIKAALQELGR